MGESKALPKVISAGAVQLPLASDAVYRRVSSGTLPGWSATGRPCVQMSVGSPPTSPRVAGPMKNPAATDCIEVQPEPSHWAA